MVTVMVQEIPESFHRKSRLPHIDAENPPASLADVRTVRAYTARGEQVIGLLAELEVD